MFEMKMKSFRPSKPVPLMHIAFYRLIDLVVCRGGQHHMVLRLSVIKGRKVQSQSMIKRSHQE